VARTGKFGRAPRTAPSLANTLAAISREFQAQRDQNILDAWKNGGLFQGKPVTDDVLLAYWNDRLAKISKNDPQYDAYSQNVEQLRYAIAESKNSLDYAQGKINDTQRAQFFLDWSAKVPKDSELYRTLQRNAAQFIERAKAVAASGASRAASDARTAADNQTIADYEAAGNYIISVMEKAAAVLGLVSPGDGLDKLSLSGAGGGPLSVPQILNLINSTPAVLEQIKAIDPSFSGVVTQAYLEQIMARRQEGIRQRKDRAEAAGDYTGANGVTALTKMLDSNGEIARQVGAYDTAQAYEAARNQWLAIRDDQSVGPEAKLRAWQKYSDTLVNLASDPSLDPITANALLAEANLDTTKDTLHENFTRGTNPSATKASDTATNVAFLQQQAVAAQALADGTGVLTYGDQNGPTSKFTVNPMGDAVGVVPITEAMTNGYEPVPVTQPDGTVVTMYLKPIPVQVVAKDANGIDLKPVDAEGNKINGVVAQAYTFSVGGKVVTIYKYEKPAYTDYAGVQHPAETGYTTATPWADGALVINDGSQIVVDISGIVQGDPSKIVTKTKTDGTTEVVGFNAADAWNPVKNTAGRNYLTDTDTLIAAVMKAVPPEEAQTVANAIKNDPRWTAILTQIMWPNGVYNPNAGAEITKAIADAAAGKPLPMDPSGFLPYDNTTNRNAFSDVTVDVTTRTVNEPKTYAEALRQRLGVDPGFTEITKLMVVPGRFGRVDQADANAEDAGVKIRRVSELSLPQVPYTGPVANPGPIVNPIAPAPYAGPDPGIMPSTPFVPPLPQNVVAPELAQQAPSPGTETSIAGINSGSATYTPGGLKGF
jgi:hypothetical protein